MINTTPTSAATLASNQVGQQANNFVKQYLNLKTNGGTIQGIAFTGAEFLTALGTTAQTVLDAMAAANPQT